LIFDSDLQRIQRSEVFPIDQTGITIYYARDPARRIYDAL
jgi:hypothetical protein